jgi:hypothetical protein
MNERIFELANEANKDIGYTFKMEEAKQLHELMEKFAELVVEDHAKKTIQGLMSDPAFVQAMDEYYENKWSHRFD